MTITSHVKQTKSSTSRDGPLVIRISDVEQYLQRHNCPINLNDIIIQRIRAIFKDSSTKIHLHNSSTHYASTENESDSEQQKIVELGYAYSISRAVHTLDAEQMLWFGQCCQKLWHFHLRRLANTKNLNSLITHASDPSLLSIARITHYRGNLELARALLAMHYTCRPTPYNFTSNGIVFFTELQHFISDPIFEYKWHGFVNFMILAVALLFDIKEPIKAFFALATLTENNSQSLLEHYWERHQQRLCQSQWHATIEAIEAAYDLLKTPLVEDLLLGNPTEALTPTTERFQQSLAGSMRDVPNDTSLTIWDESIESPESDLTPLNTTVQPNTQPQAAFDEDIQGKFAWCVHQWLNRITQPPIFASDENTQFSNIFNKHYYTWLKNQCGKSTLNKVLSDTSSSPGGTPLLNHDLNLLRAKLLFAIVPTIITKQTIYAFNKNNFNDRNYYQFMMVENSWVQNLNLEQKTACHQTWHHIIKKNIDVEILVQQLGWPAEAIQMLMEHCLSIDSLIKDYSLPNINHNENYTDYVNRHLTQNQFISCIVLLLRHPTRGQNTHMENAIELLKNRINSVKNTPDTDFETFVLQLINNITDELTINDPQYTDPHEFFLLCHSHGLLPNKAPPFEYCRYSTFQTADVRDDNQMKEEIELTTYCK